MQCPNCNAPLEKDAPLCPHCGAATQPGPAMPDNPPTADMATPPVAEEPAPAMPAAETPAPGYTPAEAAGGNVPTAENANFAAPAPEAPAPVSSPAGMPADEVTPAADTAFAAPAGYAATAEAAAAPGSDTPAEGMPTPAMAGAQPPYGETPPPAEYPGAPGQPQPYGGTQAPAGYPYAPQQAATAPWPPAPKKKKGRVVAIVLAAVLLVAALAGVLVVVLGTGGPAKQVQVALQNTYTTLASRYAATRQQLGLASISTLAKNGPVQLESTLYVQPSARTTQVSYTTAGIIDFEQAKMQFEMGIGLGSAQAVELLVGVDGNLVSLTAPQFLDDSYGFYTDSFSEDFNNSELYRLIGGVALPDGLSLDLAAWMENYHAALSGSKAPAAEGEDFWQQVTVEKGQRTDVKVNGHTQNCDVYTVTIPQELFLEWYESAVARFRDFFGNYGEEAFAELQQALEDMENSLSEDPVLTVYTVKKQAVMLQFAVEADHSYQYTLEIGNQQDLANALLLQCETDGEETLRFELEADFTTPQGVFEAEAELWSYNRNYDDLRLLFSTSLWYDAAETVDNFTFELLDADDNGFILRGSLEVDADTGALYADFYDSILLSGTEDTPLALEYRLESAPEGFEFEELDPILIFDMSEAELEAAVREFITAFTTRFLSQVDLSGYYTMK